jgi:small GTP-binding protein
VTIRDCPKLQTLLLFGNGLEEITFEGKFPELELIDLSKNALTKIDLSPANFPKLKYLYLNENKLVDLSGLTDFFVREDFDFNIGKNENSQKPPVEIVSQGKDAVRNWFKATKKKLNEIKVLVVGDAEAGKTSICKRLEFKTFDKHEKQTDGIKIRKFEFEKLKTFENQKELHGLTGYFWDFGGQEIMKSTHQFFLTHRSVYILVLEARNDKSTEELVTKWLENIQSQGGNSPVIIVINKIEVNPSCGIDPYPLKKPFPQVCGIIKISCEKDEDLYDLKSLLEKCIPNAELFNTEIDERWIEIKNELQQKTKDKFKLTETDYTDICISHGLTNVKEQEECVKFERFGYRFAFR